MEVLVDSNVILDVLTDDPVWFNWSSERLSFEADRNTLVINPIIYAEISMRFASIEDLEEVLDPLFFRKDPLPWEAAFLAGKVFSSTGRRATGEARPFRTSSLELTPRCEPCLSSPAIESATKAISPLSI